MVMEKFNNKYLKLNGNYIIRRIDNDCFIVPIGSSAKNFVIQLNDTALEAWNLLDKGLKYDDLINYFLKNYNVNKEQIEFDINVLLMECQNNKILEVK